jgi:hypothetical protein
MHRRTTAALVGLLAMGSSLAVASGASAASGPSIKVSPSSNLVNGQTVTITGTGLGQTTNGSVDAWFAAECVPKAAKIRNLDPDFSPYCSHSAYIPLQVSKAGTFSAKLTVSTGKTGKGSCGTSGHLTCLIGVGTGQGKHTTVHITFKKITLPKTKPPGSSTTSTTKG